MAISKLHEEIAEVLSAAWIRVDWQKVTSIKRSSVDVFSHRVKVAANMNTVTRFIEKLCHGLTLGSLKIDSDKIDYLESQQKEVLKILREETIYMALLTSKLVKERKDQNGQTKL